MDLTRLSYELIPREVAGGLILRSSLHSVTSFTPARSTSAFRSIPKTSAFALRAPRVDWVKSGRGESWQVRVGPLPSKIRRELTAGGTDSDRYMVSLTLVGV